MVQLRAVKGVIDRIEENEEGQSIAVVLIEEEELQLEVPMEELPTAVVVGDWLRLELDDTNNINKVIILKEETQHRRQELQSRWDRLKKRV